MAWRCCSRERLDWVGPVDNAGLLYHFVKRIKIEEKNVKTCCHPVLYTERCYVYRFLYGSLIVLSPLMDV